MSKIEAKRFLELWEEIKRLEWLNDAELCEKLGISTSNVPRWKSEAQGVRPEMVRLIQEKLNYRIELLSDGKWDVQKLSPAVKEPAGPYEPSIQFSMPGHVSEEEAARYQELLKRLGEIPEGEREATVEKVIEMIDILFRKKKS